MAKFKAYIDDYDLIVVESENMADGKQTFILWDEINFSPLTHLKTEFIDNLQKLTFKCEQLIDVGKRYYCYSAEGDDTLAFYRKIVRTEKFDDEFFYTGPLGNEYTKEKTTFHLWAPTAYNVILVLFKPGENIIYQTKNMTKESKGVWQIEIEDDLETYSYQYYVQINNKINIVTDPYADSCRLNNTATYIVDKKRMSQNKYPRSAVKISDAIIYETHIRDFTSDKEQPFIKRGYYNRFAERGVTNVYGDKIGLDYLIRSGITHVQLMPVQYYGSIDELSRFKKYNWGYDTMQHNVVAGYYCTLPDDPYNRSDELKQMINTLHSVGIGVILDVIYNHVYDRDLFSFQQIVPGYFYRYTQDNNYFDGTGCGNDIASERKMVRRYIVDSVMRLCDMYQIDGFRFDLMGITDIYTINAVRSALNSIDSNIFMYGEGWNLDTGLEYHKRAITENGMHTPNVGYFSGFFRDAIRGNSFNLSELGIANCNRAKYADIRNILLAGIDNSFLEPTQQINFVSCHDNHTLYDRYKLVMGEDQVIHNVRNSLALVLLAQGVPFIHSGAEFMRTKKMLENSYNCDDSFNKIDWNRCSEKKFLVIYVDKLIQLRKQFKSMRLETRHLIIQHCNVHVDGDTIFYTIDNIQSIDGIKSLQIIINLGYSRYYLNKENLKTKWSEITDLNSDTIEISSLAIESPKIENNHIKCIMINETQNLLDGITTDDIVVIEPASIAVFTKGENHEK